MGNRVTVSIYSKEFANPVNIYAHWAGDDIYPIVQGVLESSQRIGDASYLSAAIIHGVFTQLGYDGKTSFGIWSGDADEDGWRDNETMYVDGDDGTWRIGDSEYFSRDSRVGDVSF